MPAWTLLAESPADPAAAREPALAATATKASPTILAALGCWLEQVYLIWAGAGTLVVRLAWESEKLTGLAWGVGESSASHQD